MILLFSAGALFNPYAVGCDLESCQARCSTDLYTDTGDCATKYADENNLRDCILKARIDYRDCNKLCLVHNGNIAPIDEAGLF